MPSNLLARIKSSPYPWILLGVCVLAFFTNLHGYPLFDVDEPRYMETAREFLVTPYDWITPHFNWIKRFDKPILYYWLVASVYKAIGVSELAGRLVSATAGTVSVLALYGTLSRFRSRQFAFLASLILAVSTEFYLLSRWAITDMTLACCMITTTLCLFLSIEKNRMWSLLAGMACGLGLLTKGPVALALPGTTAFIYLLLCQRRQWRWLFCWQTLVGVALAFAIAFPWYWAVHTANPGEFFEKFFLLHNVERFSKTVSSHTGPFWYYIPVVFVGLTPWTLLLLRPLYMKQLMGNVLHVFSHGVKPLWQRFQNACPTTKYALIWFLFVLIFFSLAGTKLLTYVLSLFPAGAVLLAVLLQTHNRPKTLYSIATAFVGLQLIANFVILPWVANDSQQDLLAISRRVKTDQAALATYQCKRPSLVFYSQTRVYYIEGASESTVSKTFSGASIKQAQIKDPAAGDTRVVVRAADVTTSPKQAVYVVTRTRQAEEFQEQYESSLVFQGDTFSLLRLTHPEHVPLRKDMNQ
jgi:4-amino-4-deoxy-L-arabinose transferase-like glycosyltransferase